MPDVRPDIREVYEMVTKQKPSDTGAFERQRTRQIRTMRNRKIGAFALTATIAVAAIAVILGTRGQPNDATLGGQPPANPFEVATSFLEAYGAFDADQALTYLADDADVSRMSLGSEGTLEEFRLSIPMLEAQGFDLQLGACEEQGTGSFGTDIRCIFDFHMLGADEIGLGPFRGSFIDLTVQNGKIVSGALSFDIEKFSPQMWEPFAAWVSTTHPKDAAMMYEDETYSIERITERSIRLWERHVQGYVEHVQQGGGPG